MSTRRRDFLRSMGLSASLAAVSNLMVSCSPHETQLPRMTSEEEFDSDTYRFWSSGYVLPQAGAQKNFLPSGPVVPVPVTPQTDISWSDTTSELKSHIPHHQESGAPAVNMAYETNDKIPLPTSDMSGACDSKLIDQTKSPRFYFYDQQSGFLSTEGTSGAPLPQAGNAQVTFNGVRFRPSQDLRDRFKKLRYGTLQIELADWKDVPELQEPLSWSNIAVIAAGKNGILPSSEILTFNPQQTFGHGAIVYLPGGCGSWRCNLFLEHPDSWWSNMISHFIDIDKVALPLMFGLLGLPTIALTALNSLNGVLGFFKASGCKSATTPETKKSDKVVLNQLCAASIFATEEGRQSVGHGIELRTGQYVIVPDAQASPFEAGMSQYKLSEDGYIVPKDTAPQNTATIGPNNLPFLDYLTLSVQVKV